MPVISEAAVSPRFGKVLLAGVIKVIIDKNGILKLCIPELVPTITGKKQMNLLRKLILCY